MFNVLLLSTYWYDISNRQVLVSHNNDGLNQMIFANISNIIANSLTHTINTGAINYNISKYMVIAMNSTKESISPMIICKLFKLYITDFYFYIILYYIDFLYFIFKVKKNN
jgi:hypothetical protein